MKNDIGKRYRDGGGLAGTEEDSSGLLQCSYLIPLLVAVVIVLYVY